MTETSKIEDMKKRLASGDDPGCTLDLEYGGPTCIATDAVNNACPACLRCTIKAGYDSPEARWHILVGGDA